MKFVKLLSFSHWLYVANCQSQDQIEEERERVNASIVALEDELENCRDQEEQWKKQLEATTQEYVSISQVII